MSHGAVPRLAGLASITAYTLALQTANALDRQTVKDITAWGGLRNSAAHGEFDAIDIQRARLMADGINLFMQHGAVRGPRTPPGRRGNLRPVVGRRRPLHRGHGFLGGGEGACPAVDDDPPRHCAVRGPAAAADRPRSTQAL